MPTPAQLKEREQLRIDEGVRKKPYQDTKGKLTAGVGRNLDDVGLRGDEIDLMLDNDIAQAVRDAEQYLGKAVFDALSDDRQRVLLNMAFNLGFTKLSGFKQFRAALIARDYTRAAAEMMDSAWSKQVGQRAIRLKNRMIQG